MTVSPQLSPVPELLLVSIPTFLFFVAAYQLLAPRFRTERQRAYVLSVISSCTMSLIALPFLYSYIECGLQITYENGQSGWMRETGRFGVIFFATYLFSDVSLLDGTSSFQHMVGLLTGWIHHTAYLTLMMYLLNTRHIPIFLIGSVMEVPTFDLALSNLFPQVRNDFRFLSSFFIFRIVFHAVMLVDCARSITITDGSYVPIAMFALTGILHVSWFCAGVTGYLKRRQISPSGENWDNIKADDKGQDALLNAVADIDSTVLETALPTTPDSSPLITPRTPSQMPYLFPNIPTLSISALPKVQIPNLPAIPSFNDMSAALNKETFKDAVKNRWDEQRGKLAVRSQGFRLKGMKIRRQVTIVGEQGDATEYPSDDHHESSAIG
ncbi:hypothetical protein IAR55_000197 [Kwoniella newhampshirensis]|uniref:TLC domain-containing protein n=1 Tax=Kwoniella newhampshirensis TaxID=1651941 RepID=A0AAW0Z628_9TREE